MARRPSHAGLGAIAFAASMTLVASGCAIASMSPLSSTHTVEKTPSCTESSGSVGLDVVWGLIWGVPAIASFGEDEPGLGLLFALVSGIHVASAVTGVKWGNKCKAARQDHDQWLAEQSDLLKQQQRANALLQQRQGTDDAQPPPDAPADNPSPPSAGADTVAGSPATAPATAPATPAPAPATADPAPTPAPSRASLRLPTPRPPAPVRQRNDDPWAEFWQEVAR